MVTAITSAQAGQGRWRGWWWRRGWRWGRRRHGRRHGCMQSRHHCGHAGPSQERARDHGAGDSDGASRGAGAGVGVPVSPAQSCRRGGSLQRVQHPHTGLGTLSTTCSHNLGRLRRPGAATACERGRATGWGRGASGACSRLQALASRGSARRCCQSPTPGEAHAVPYLPCQHGHKDHHTAHKHRGHGHREGGVGPAALCRHPALERHAGQEDEHGRHQQQGLQGVVVEGLQWTRVVSGQ
jgi:hypothetical protein